MVPRFLAPGLAALFLALGCQGKSLTPVPVKGKVQFEGGKPLADARLSFHPLDEVNKKSFPSANTDKNGNFNLSCIKGRYRITFLVLKGKGGIPPGGKPSGLAEPERPDSPFQTPQSYTWEIEIPDSGKEDLVLTVKKKK